MSYQIRLYYGWQETEEGVFHSFIAHDPDGSPEPVELIDVSFELAGLLDTTVNDSNFNYNGMYINLPDTLVERIKQDAVREFKEQLSDAVHKRLSAL